MGHAAGMDLTTQLVALVAAATVGLVATILIMRRQRHAAEEATRENPFAVATEGMQLCPACRFANMVGDATCSACGKDLPG